MATMDIRLKITPEGECELSGCESTKPFPVLRDLDGTIPLAWAAEVYVEYARRYGREQSLERIAERGGFSAWEIADLLLARLRREDGSEGAF